MKQRIDLSQLQQLTPSQQEKLRAWWKPEIGDVFTCTGNEFLEGKIFSCDGNNKVFSLSLPLLSIGQCIELLGVPTTLRVITNTDKETLIDALFEAVKSIL